MKQTPELTFNFTAHVRAIERRQIKFFNARPGRELRRRCIVLAAKAIAPRISERKQLGVQGGHGRKVATSRRQMRWESK